MQACLACLLFFCHFFDTDADVARELHSATLELLIKRRKGKKINCDPELVSKLKAEFPTVSDMELAGRKRK